MTRLKIILRRFRTLLWTAFSILVILAAVLVGVGKLLMPYSDRYQPRLEAWLSREFGQPVRIESFQGEWTAFGPRISLQGMQLLPPAGAGGEAAGTLIESAALDIKPLSWLIPGLPHYAFRVTGADFKLLRTAEGALRLSGFGVRQAGSDSQRSALRDLLRVGEVVLRDSSLDFEDEKLGIHLGLEDIDGRLAAAGDELSLEVDAQLFDARSGLVYGEIDATARLEVDGDGKPVSATWQATARELMMAALQGRVPPSPFMPLTGWLSAELWGNWSRGQDQHISGVVDFRDGRLVSEHQDMQIDHLNARFQWHFGGRRNWRLDVADLLLDAADQSWEAPRITVARDTAKDLGLWISADRLPLAAPLNLTRDIMGIYGTPWPAWLPHSAQGRVEDLDVVLNSTWRVRAVRGRVSDASVSEWGRWPDLQGLEGSVSLVAGGGQARFSGQQVVMNWPRMFRDPITIDVPGCNLDMGWGQGWQLRFTNCRAENEVLSVAGDVLVKSDENKPRVDVNVALLQGDIARFGSYWPEALLRDNVKTWLRRGLKSGQVRSARLQIRGDMDDWPFRHGEGRFEAVAMVEKAHLDYLEGWPAARDADATVRFDTAAMDIRGNVGDIGGATADGVTARIADLKQPLLEVGYHSGADLPVLLEFLENTPLREQIEVDLSAFGFSGRADTRGRITVPLGTTAGRLTVDGTVALQGDRFSDPGSGVTIEDISGELDYDERGFMGRGLKASFKGREAKLDLFADADAQEKFRADLGGIFDVHDMIPGFLLDDFKALSRIGGDCWWQVSLLVAPDAVSGENAAVLEVQSELIGIGIDLPEPLHKKTGESWPLVLEYPLGGPSRILDLRLKDRVSMRFELAGSDEPPRRAAIRLGGGEAALPGAGMLRMDGEADLIDLDGWLEVITDEVMRGSGMGGLRLDSGNVHAASIRFIDRRFEDVSMSLDADGESLLAGFDAQDLNGNLRFTSAENGTNSLFAEFDRLVLGEPLSGGMETETHPSEWPVLHLYAASFSYAGIELGETRIEAYPTPQGFHFDKVDSSSERLSVQARGDWLGEGNQQRSDFDVHMTSESLGDFLESMELGSQVQGGQTVVEFKAWWPGPPASFALSRLNGELEFSVIDGNISGASAGSGRLLGLFSVAALPKRLALDFRDVFDSGFSFDEATGTFRLEDGIATTDNVLLKSSAATITITGKTDLVNRRYDQLVTIKPGVGNTLPIIGALAAGPGGAAAGLALQGLLQNELAEATQVRYRVTGDWDDPQFEAVEVEKASPQKGGDELQPQQETETGSGSETERDVKH